MSLSVSESEKSRLRQRNCANTTKCYWKYKKAKNRSVWHV